MDTTINRRQKKKELEAVSALPLDDNTGLSIRKEDKSIPAEILYMSDDDPRLIRFMEEVEQERRKRHPNQTHEELKKNVDALLETHATLRKKEKAPHV